MNTTENTTTNTTETSEVEKFLGVPAKVAEERFRKTFDALAGKPLTAENMINAVKAQTEMTENEKYYAVFNIARSASDNPLDALMRSFGGNQ